MSHNEWCQPPKEDTSSVAKCPLERCRILRLPKYCVKRRVFLEPGFGFSNQILALSLNSNKQGGDVFISCIKLAGRVRSS